MKNLTNSTKLIIGILLLILIIAFEHIQYQNIKTVRQQNIKAYQYKTIAKVKNFTYNDSFGPNYEIVYFYNGKKYTNCNEIHFGGGELCIGKYYTLELSTQNPNYANILLEQEVTDTALIKKVGFMKN